MIDLIEWIIRWGILAFTFAGNIFIATTWKDMIKHNPKGRNVYILGIFIIGSLYLHAAGMLLGFWNRQG